MRGNQDEARCDMAERFFVEQPITGSAVVLTGGEAHHAAHVLRAAPGDEVVVFDGSGAEYLTRVTRVERRAVELSVVERRVPCRELPLRVTIGAALPKGERQRWLVEKLVELGVAEFVPLLTSRGVAQPTAAALDRLRKGVVEASKQCGRNHLMAIASATRLAAFLRRADPAALRVLAHPNAAPWACPTDLASSRRACCFAVGPEGGFTESELEDARAQRWLCCGLGPRILRVETAAVTWAALVAALCAAHARDGGTAT